MESIFDQYEFENYLIDEFFNGSDFDEIGDLIKKQLASNSDFREKYELWIEESSYRNWKEYYQFLEDEEDMAWGAMYPNNEE